MMSKTLKLADYLGKPFDCSCGRTHSTTLEGVTVSAGAMKALPEYVEKYGFKNLYIACDEITYGIAGEKVMNILKDAGIKAKAHVFKGKRFIPDEKALGELMIDADRDCDLVVAVGTGSINDMCRFFSFQMGVPYAIVATAAPMDGFASSGAALIINSMKTTIPAQTPLFIIGDTDILCGAPARMVSAGLGDLLGKFTCLNDWRISKVVNDEYYCDEIVNLVTDCIENVLADADNVASRDPKVIGDIMEGLVLTGVAMSFIGNSRPAAGCEHHMCHFWETLELQEGKIPVLHGTKVAVGTVMILKMTEFLRENRPDFDAAREKAKAYDQAAYLGFISAGGSMPADMALAGVLGVAYAITGNLDADTALAIAVPIGLLGTIVWYLRMTIDSVFVHMGDKWVAEGKFNNLYLSNVILPQIFSAIICVTPCTLAAYFGADYIQSFIDMCAGKPLQIFQVIGGLMPALGIAITLQYIFKGEARIFLFLGFMIATVSGMTLIEQGIVGLIMAIIYIQLAGGKTAVAATAGAPADGAYDPDYDPDED